MKRKTIRHGVSWYKKKADAVFSKWIRARDKKCVTCGSRGNLQCGHFVSRSCNQLRYGERNCHAQCVGCNIFKNGNMVEYAVFMEKTYGHGIIQELKKEKVKTRQFSIKDLEDIINLYDVSV